MCVPPPMRPNIHARPEGYRVMAGAFAAALAQANLDGNPLRRVGGVS